MEVLTQVPATGTKLRIEADRPFDVQQGDSVLRIQGQSQDGSQTFDAAYVEVEPREADVTARMLRASYAPPAEWVDKIAQEVQATFSSRLSGRDAQQIAHIAAHAIRLQAALWLGEDSPEKAQKHLERLSEKFERAAAKRAQAPSFGGPGNGQQQQGSPEQGGVPTSGAPYAGQTQR